RMSLVTTSTLRTGRAASAAESPAAPDPSTTTSTSRSHDAGGAANRRGRLTGPPVTAAQRPLGDGCTGVGVRARGSFGGGRGGADGDHPLDRGTGTIGDVAWHVDLVGAGAQRPEQLRRGD